MSNEPTPPPEAPVVPNVASLSADAQLATALVIQSQALEGMRVAQSDLLRRVDGSAAAFQLRAAVDDIERAADQVRRAQDDAVASLAASRRKIVTSVALVGMFVVAAVAWGVWWVDGRLDEQLPGGIDAVRAERDALAAELAGVSTTVAELESDLGTERERHFTALGELSRVRTDYAASQAAMGDIRDKLSELPARDATDASSAGQIVASLGAARPDAPDTSLAADVNAAVRASGSTALRVVEVGHIAEGRLHDVLFVEVNSLDGSPTGPAARAAQAWVSLSSGHASLRLDGGDIAAGDQRVVKLERYTAEPWEALGVAPEGSSLVDVRAALDELLGARTRYRVARLGGVSTDGTLEDVVLEEVGSRGEVMRSLVAQTASVSETGSLLAELVLSDGHVLTGDMERPFYRGVFRLNIPGADLRGWNAVLRQDQP